MTDRVGREWGEELCMIIVEPDPRLEQLRRLDEWLRATLPFGSSTS
jgi:hypothetical protein